MIALTKYEQRDYESNIYTISKEEKRNKQPAIDIILKLKDWGKGDRLG